MKKETKLNIDSNKTIDLLFDGQFEDKDLVETIKKAVLRAFDYFEKVEAISFGIEMIYSRDEFDQQIGHKTESWTSAHSFGDRFIIFSPSVIEKYTTHDKNEFEQIVAHETAHVLLYSLNPISSTWLNEGIAQNIAKQDKEVKIEPKKIAYFIKEILFKNSDYEKFIANQGYQISYKLVKSLMEKYSKNTVAKLLQIPYSFSKSSEKDVCEVLNTNRDELIAELTEVLKRP